MRRITHLLTCAVLLLAAPQTTHADRPGWNEPGRAPEPDQAGLLRINADSFDLAAATGGDFYFWGPGEFAAAAGHLNVPLAAEPIALAYGRDGGALDKTLAIPVDGTVTELSLFAGAQRLDALQVRRPDGRTVAVNPAGVTVQAFTYMRIITIAAPEPGLWQATLDGAGGFELAARARSDRATLRQRELKAIDLLDFEFVEERGRPGHQGLFALKEPPLAGTTQRCRITLSGQVAPTAVELVSNAGDVLATLHVAAGDRISDDEWLLACPVPDRPFRVQVRGKDTEGYPFQRSTAGLVTPAIR